MNLEDFSLMRWYYKDTNNSWENPLDGITQRHTQKYHTKALQNQRFLWATVGWGYTCKSKTRGPGWWVSWKQGPLRPPEIPKLKNKDPPYFCGLRNYDQLVANVTESWALVTWILMLLLASWSGIRGSDFVWNLITVSWFQARNLPLVSSKFLTFFSTENDLDKKMKARLLFIAPKTVTIHAM